MLGAAGMFATMYSTQAILPELSRDFGVSPSQAGLSISVVVVAVAVGGFAWGPFSDRIGRPRAIRLASVLLVPPTIGVALAPGFAALLALPHAPGTLHAGSAHGRGGIHRGGVRAEDRSPGDGLLRLVARRRRARRAAGRRARERGRGLARRDRRPRGPSPGGGDLDAQRLAGGVIAATRWRHGASPPQRPAARGLARCRGAVLHLRRRLHVHHVQARGAAVLLLCRCREPRVHYSGSWA